LGYRSVFNAGHKDEDLDAVTQKQSGVLFPILKAHLKGTEKTALDFGCGPGRFTRALADAIGGTAVGVDPIDELLAMAPKSPNVSYVRGDAGHIPLPDESVDLVWICLVMGGLTSRQLRSGVAEIKRVLRKGGLVFLVENTTQDAHSVSWNYYSSETYARLFNWVDLQRIHEYEDLGETITVMAGRRKPVDS
jgi:ubiquinone/menaquinone biosynthesis C-methylase UbiE